MNVPVSKRIDQQVRRIPIVYTSVVQSNVPAGLGRRKMTTNAYLLVSADVPHFTDNHAFAQASIFEAALPHFCSQCICHLSSPVSASAVFCAMRADV